MNIIPEIKKGPKLGKVLEEQIKWQLRNPNGLNDDLLIFLKNYYHSIE